MRTLLAAVLVLAGCLHAQRPLSGASKDDPGDVRTFERLINEPGTIGAAMSFAETRGLHRESIVGPAERAYWAYLKAGAFVPAAEVAWRVKAGDHEIKRSFMFARDAAAKSFAEHIARKGEAGETSRRYAAAWHASNVVRIACRYGPTEASKKTAIRDATDFSGHTGDMTPLYATLDEGCPVDVQQRIAIIDAAYHEGKYAFAILHAAASERDPVRDSQFLARFFAQGNCTHGFKALEAFKIPFEGAVRIVEIASCEDETIDSRDWKLSSEAADAYFFAAVRGRKYNLALELLPLGSLGADGQAFLFQEASRGGFEGGFVAKLKLHMAYHDPFMAFMWERGRYRFIASFAQTYDWQRKAFDKLIELRQWDFAAEAAQYGFSETLRTEGVLIAFRAAMAAGDFKSGRYFVARYGPREDKAGIVTQEMYDGEHDKWFAAKLAAEPPPPKKTKRKRHGKKRRTCAPDDWCP